MASTTTTLPFGVAAATPGIPYDVAAPTTTTRVASSKYPSWEYDLIRALGGTVTDAKLVALNLWAKAEGMPAATNNPLAITDPGQEFGPTGGDPTGAIAPGVWNNLGGAPGVVTFKTQAAGVSAIASFINHGHAGVAAALRDPNATVASIGAAVAKDGAWGGDGVKILGWSNNADVLSAKQVYTGGSATGPQGAEPGRGPSSFTQCNSANTIVGGGVGPLKWNILNPCQAKALVGGLLTATGIIVIGLGFAVMFRGASLPALPARGPEPEPAASRARWEQVHGRPWTESDAGKRTL